MRIFICIEIPEEIKNSIATIQNGLKQSNVRIVNKDILHVTLNFLGDFKEDNLPLLYEKLSRINIKGFKISLRGIDAFRNGDVKGIVFVKIFDGEMNVKTLSETINDFLGIKNAQDFNAHLTIARVKESYEIWDKIRVYKDKYFGEFFVTSIKIKNSTLTNEGPIYKDLKEIILL